jgi:sugar phosphate isomerase/epimerase
MTELLFGTKIGRRDFPKTMMLKPKAVEFHTTKGDLIHHFDEMKRISSQIKVPKAVHVPISVDGVPFHMSKHLYFVERCIELGELIVIHPDTERGGEHDRILASFIESLRFFENKKIKVAVENVSQVYDDGKTRIRHDIGSTIDDFKVIFQRWPQYGMCFDVCHAAMAGQNIEEWFRELGKHMIHFHFSDSRDGIEGMQIGDGNINWKDVFAWVEKYCSGRVAVIPEIKGGHNNNAAGFRIALERLRKLY